MKQSKQSSDAQKVNDLLKKLQGAYLGTKNDSTEEQKSRDSVQDRALREQLKDVLEHAENTAEQSETDEAEEQSAANVSASEEPKPNRQAEKPKAKKTAAKKAPTAKAEQKPSADAPAVSEQPAAPKRETATEAPKATEAPSQPAVPTPPKKKAEKNAPAKELSKKETAPETVSVPITIASPTLSAVTAPSKETTTVGTPLIQAEVRATTAPPPKKEVPKPTADRASEQADDVVAERKEPTSTEVPKQKPNETEEAPIVIKPKEEAKPVSEPIVIRPRVRSTPAVAPQTMEEERAKQPISIGKKRAAAHTDAPSVTLPKGAAPVTPPRKEPPAAAKKATTEKATLRSEKPKKAAEPQAGNAQEPSHTAPAKKRSSSVSMPRPLSKRPHTAPKPTVSKKKAVRQEEPSDEQFNENLDIALEDELLPATEPEEIPMDAPDRSSADVLQKNTATRRRLLRQQAEESKLSALELAKKRSGLNEDDIAMIFELGYEHELARLLGYDVMRKLKNEHLRKIGRSNRKHYRTSLGYRGEEYAGGEQKTAVLAAYFHDRKQLVLQTVFTALLTFVLLFADMPYLIDGGALSAFAAAYPAALPVVGVLLLLVCAGLSRRQLLAGLCSFFKFSPTPYSVNAVLLPLCVVYDVLCIAVFPWLFPVNFIMALALLLTQLLELLRLRSELKIFQLISADCEKTVLEDATPRKKKLRQGEKIVKIINDDLGREMFRVRKAKQVTGFFRRFNSNDAAALPFTLFLCTTLLLSLMVSIVRAIQADSISEALSAFMSTLLIGAPLSAQIGFLYPLVRANGLLMKRNCALLGEESAEEYDRHQRLIFRDDDLYRVEKKAELSVRRGDELRRDLRLAGILFRKVGGTLRVLGQTGPLTDADDPRVSVLRITETGLEAIVDNKYHILAGDSAFLQKSGVRTPPESDDQALRRNERTGLMYVAIDGTVKLSYELEYRSQKSFEELIDLLAENDTSVAVFTYDPNISNSFLQSSRPEGEPVHVYKPGRFEPEESPELLDSGAIALGEPTDIVYPLLAAKSIGRIRKTVWRMQLIASIIGALGVLLLPLLKLSLLSTVGTILLYQLFWCLLSVITASTELRRHTFLP